VIRITNIRANANQLGVSSTLIPTQIVMFISVTGTTSVPINNPQQTVAQTEGLRLWPLFLAIGGLSWLLRKLLRRLHRRKLLRRSKRQTHCIEIPARQSSRTVALFFSGDTFLQQTVLEGTWGTRRH